MFQYLLTFLLINSCYQSLGIAIDSNSHVIAKSLLSLSTQCGNAALTKEINKYTQPCAQTAPPYHKHQVQCLMFYDINKLLCAAAAESKVIIKEDFAASLAEKQDVNVLCAATSDWVFSNMSDYPEYKVHADHVKRIASCGEICGQEEAMDEASIYCKYFKWGFETLKTQLLAAKSKNSVVVPAPAVIEPDLGSKGDIQVPKASNAANEIVEEPKPAKEVHTKSAAAQITPGKVEPPKPNEITENKPTNSQPPTSIGSTPKPIADLKFDEKSIETGNGQPDPAINLPESSILKAEQLNKSTSPSAMKADEAQVLPHPELSKDVPEPSKELPETRKDIPELAKDLPDDTDQKDIGNIDQQRPNDDYDSEVNDNLGDDDADDIGMAKLEPETVPHKQFIPTHNRESSLKEFNPNTMSDGFTEDGDHFFPFFLTAIILVVLLYVLYHNKNKVSKVFFGLMFEGRQGRRRNSRGHAYRRLDTLEQAMSANAAAPPSKIIY